MVNAILHELEVPDDEAVRQAADALAGLQAFLQSNPSSSSLVELRSDQVDDRTQLVLPQVALRLVADVLAQIANGNAVTVAPVHGELTTQQAADLINVSRPYLIKLLDERQVPYRRVGNRRKVRLDDLLAYQRRDDERRRHVLDELTREAETLGLDY
jgi:excisionase family DNA binding protein